MSGHPEPARTPQDDLVKFAELRARLDKRMVDQHGENWRDLPVDRDSLEERERQGP